MEKREYPVVITVVESRCDLYKIGDKIYINGPLIDTEKSSNICTTAMMSIYSFVFAMRKGVTAEELGYNEPVTVQCPDYCAPVIFNLAVDKADQTQRLKNIQKIQSS